MRSELFDFSYSKNQAFPYSNSKLEHNNKKKNNDNKETHHFAAAVVLEAPLR